MGEFVGIGFILLLGVRGLSMDEFIGMGFVLLLGVKGLSMDEFVGMDFALLLGVRGLSMDDFVVISCSSFFQPQSHAADFIIGSCLLSEPFRILSIVCIVDEPLDSRASIL